MGNIRHATGIALPGYDNLQYRNTATLTVLAISAENPKFPTVRSLLQSWTTSAYLVETFQ